MNQSTVNESRVYEPEASNCKFAPSSKIKFRGASDVVIPRQVLVCNFFVLFFILPGPRRSRRSAQSVSYRTVIWQAFDVQGSRQNSIFTAQRNSTTENPCLRNRTTALLCSTLESITYCTHYLAPILRQGVSVRSSKT